MRASVRMLARMRQRLLSRLAAKPAGWFASQRAGELLARVDGDAAEVQKFAFNAVLGGSSALIRLMGGSAMLMVLDWRLGLLTALLAPAELAFLIWARPRTERRAAAVREMQGRYSAGLSETLFGLPALQAARGTAWAERRSLRDHAGLSQRLIAQNLWGEFTRAVPVLLSALTRSAIFLAGGLMVIRGEWPLGSLIAFVAYMGFMAQTVTFSFAALAAAGIALAGSAAQADTWRYAFEEAMTDVQGVYAQKFKEEIEANSDHEIQLFPYGTLGESADIMLCRDEGVQRALFGGAVGDRQRGYV